MQRKIVVAMSTLVFMALSVGVAIAYFSYTQRTPLGEFQTGSTDVVITAGPVSAQNITPGQTSTFSYSLENVGTVPVQLRAQLKSVWSDVALDIFMVQGTELAVDRGSGTQVIYAHPFSIIDEFYFSDTGTDAALWELAPGEAWNVYVTAQLDEQAGTEYMLASYVVEAIVGVREVGTQVPWPQF